MYFNGFLATNILKTYSIENIMTQTNSKSYSSLFVSGLLSGKVSIVNATRDRIISVCIITSNILPAVVSLSSTNRLNFSLNGNYFKNILKITNTLYNLKLKKITFVFQNKLMFSTGQLIFAGLFVVAFVVLMVFSYRKDKTLHRKHYKGSLFILLGFFAFVAILVMMKFLLKS